MSDFTEVKYNNFGLLILLLMPCISGPDLTSDGEGISKILSGHIAYLQNISLWTQNIFTQHIIVGT